jgi:hypothetical protein
MATNLSTISKSGLWLRRKRNFYRFSILAVGVPTAIIVTVMLGGLVSSPLWIVFIVGASLLVGLLWGFFMWHFFSSHFPSMPDRRENDAA